MRTIKDLATIHSRKVELHSQGAVLRGSLFFCVGLVNGKPCPEGMLTFLCELKAKKYELHQHREPKRRRISENPNSLCWGGKLEGVHKDND